MEFEDEHDEEQEEEEDDEDEITIPPPAVPPSYVDSVMGGVNSVPHRVNPVNHSPSGEPRRSGTAVRYRECLKNHAVGIGGHALDGCGEFMPAGNDGTLDALKCAACNCHRNFHRKEVADPTDGGGSVGGGVGGGIIPSPPPTTAVYSGYFRSTPTTPSGYLHMSSHHRPHVPALPSSNTSGGTHSGDMEMGDDMSHPSSSGGGRDSAGMMMMSGNPKKRHRTKFTQEQKDKMLAFAEKLGWRIQKHDEAAVQQFCGESQIRRQVLKVWMHNNKHTLGKKP